MALQKRFNDLWKQFVDPYWTIISGVLSHGRGRPKNDVDRTQMRRLWERPASSSRKLTSGPRR